MSRLLLGLAFVAALAVSVHARTALAPARIEPANWTVAGAPDLQTAQLRTMVGFHALQAGF
jgi:hypothetical protein